MQEILGGPEKYAEAFLEKLNQVLASGENLDLAVLLGISPKRATAPLPAAPV